MAHERDIRGASGWLMVAVLLVIGGLVIFSFVRGVMAEVDVLDIEISTASHSGEESRPVPSSMTSTLMSSDTRLGSSSSWRRMISVISVSALPSWN